MKDQNEIETRIRERLSEIKEVPQRNPQTASRGRALFFSQAVSVSESARHKGWMTKSRKERFVMNTLISTLLIAGLLFGGGVTVNAAQNELPNQPLYDLKILSEDIGLQFQNTPEKKVDRLMELAKIRIQEMAKLAENDETIPDQVRLRLERHIRQALQTCITMDDATLDRTLLQIRDRLQQRDRDMEQLKLRTQDQAQLLTQTRTMLREQLQLVENGLHNPDTFRINVQNGFRQGQDEELTPPVLDGNQEQNGQSTLIPDGPNTEPGVPNTDPGGSNIDPGGKNNNSGSGGNGPVGNEMNNNGSGGKGK